MEAYLPNPSPGLNSTRNHRFDEVPAPRIQRSSFDLSHKRKTTFNAGYLIPLCVMEVLPGDTFNVNAQFFGRLQTLDFPVLDNMYFDTFWFYCPNRLLWANWARFLGALEPNNDSSIDFTIPILNDPQIAVHEVGDYMGLPITNSLADQDISALPFRMYTRVWNEWFRAQELQDNATSSTGDGPESYGLYKDLLRRGKRHDYITSCLVAPQRGDAVQLPLGTSAPVVGNGMTLGLMDSTNFYGMSSTNGAQTLRITQSNYEDPVGTAEGTGSKVGTTSLGVTNDPDASGMIADLSSAVAATINDIREMVTIQQILERDARFGTRYVERIFAQFGVVVPDYTAQRPEYLGGSIDRVGILQVPQMTASPVTPTMSDAKGALAAYAQIQASSGFNKSFVEHGYIMCLGSLRADLTYQERIDKMWTRSTRFDFYDPLMAHLGEQAVLNREVFYELGNPTGVFGYQERYAEYRMKLSDVTGKFRSAVGGGALDSWHLALEFGAEVDLNATFIQDNPPLDRILTIDSGTEPNCLMDMAFNIRAARPIPVYSVPGLERL